MPTNIVIPEMGESVRTGVVSNWVKNTGDYVNRDDLVMELETDKITMEIRAPSAGSLTTLANVGDTVPVGAVVARVDEAAAPAQANGAPPAPAAPATTAAAPAAAKATPTPAASPAPVVVSADVRATPLARKVAEQHHVDLSQVRGTGAGGRIREQDVMAMVDGKGAPTATLPSPSAPSPSAAPVPSAAAAGDRSVRRERMSPLRQRIAARLVEAQHTAAMLTTFNEVDMTAVIELRKRHKDAFEKKHGVGLGFMSFFVKAAVNALRQFPAVNAYIVQGAGGGAEVEFHDYYDVAVAVGTPKGLVVPVLRNCDRLSFSQIESGIKDLATRAKDGKLGLDDLTGGTFTITNGGIYGSLMSTPILNPPQSGILGMHAIKNRAVEDPRNPGQVAIRPMMFLALSYDHRIIDGAEAVQFLVSIKNSIEEPERLLLSI